MVKKMLCAAIALALALSSLCVIHALAEAPAVKNVQYLGNGVVGVAFQSAVEYKNAKVTVKDEAGNSYTAALQSKSANGLRIKFENPRTLTRYKFIISGIRAKGEGEYGSASDTFRVPDVTKPILRSTAYEGKRVVSVRFLKPVQYKKDFRILVRDADGSVQTAKVVRKTANGLTFRFAKGVSGQSYQFDLGGLRVKGQREYESLRGAFRIPPSSMPTLKSVSYDAGYVTVEFKQTLEYKTADKVGVIVKDAKGRTVKSRFVKCDGTRVQFQLQNPAVGNKYSFALSGLRTKGGRSFQTFKGSVRTPAK